MPFSFCQPILDYYCDSRIELKKDDLKFKIAGAARLPFWQNAHCFSWNLFITTCPLFLVRFNKLLLVQHNHDCEQYLGAYGY